MPPDVQRAPAAVGVTGGVRRVRPARTRCRAVPKQAGEGAEPAGTSRASRAFSVPSFGQDRDPASSLSTEQKFTGQVQDASTGLYWYRSRYYDPNLIRFAQPDTIIPDYANPQALNRYSYVLNNPLKYTDPTGHASVGPEAPRSGPHITVVERETRGPNVTTIAQEALGALVTTVDRVVSGPLVTVIQRGQAGPRIHTDGGLGRTSHVYASDPYEESRRAELAKEYDQPYGTTDEEIRRNLGIEGKAADFVGRHRESGEWLIAEMKGGNLDVAVVQMRNTYDHWSRRHRGEGVEFRIYSSRYGDLQAGREFGGYGVDEAGKLGYEPEGGGFLREQIAGRDIDVRE